MVSNLWIWERKLKMIQDEMNRLLTLSQREWKALQKKALKEYLTNPYDSELFLFRPDCAITTQETNQRFVSKDFNSFDIIRETFKKNNPLINQPYGYEIMQDSLTEGFFELNIPAPLSLFKEEVFNCLKKQSKVAKSRVTIEKRRAGSSSSKKRDPHKKNILPNQVSI